jgi:hypothetical protein
MSGPSAPAVHHGDFAAGIRSRLHLQHHAVPGDFAAGLRLSEVPASA